jgi:hypothetical protein
MYERHCDAVHQRRCRSGEALSTPLEARTLANRQRQSGEIGSAPRVERELTFGEFAAIYKQRHVLSKGLATGRTIDYRLKLLMHAFTAYQTGH